MVVEQVCPFKQCGRKFVSVDQLRVHIDRRHKAVEQPKEQLTVSTPVPTKSKIVDSTPHPAKSKDIVPKQQTMQIDTMTKKP